ncbi:MGH1-like glycoside hydrolase domain-containing protein [Bryobacter aggregatus]|uniref:MGH1-like glycoside hydrolase domain-containing protein n=1 Tax=Bryobacter aggregatus TaxID=360054 RepID=UPI00055D4A72|nr:glucosidase [Bryobacter aggregatus]
MATPVEWRRLAEERDRTQHWRRWGAYLSERQWGTVREDYSAYGEAWDYFPFEVAHKRAYRWGEDGLLGICDNHCRLCFSIALWNGRDPILKERLYGLAGPLGNHGEDVKELYYYLDATPTASYLRGLYKYPQAEFPYELLREKGRLPRSEPEFELIDTGIFDENRYFDIDIEYAKASVNDILIRITVHNRGPEAAPLHLLGQLYFRNLWSFGRDSKPSLSSSNGRILAHHPSLGNYEFHAEGAKEFLFTENETDGVELYGFQPNGAFFKDGFGEYLIRGKKDAINSNRTGTKAAALYQMEIPAGGSRCFHMRLREQDLDSSEALAFDEVFRRRIAEADEYYDDVLSRGGTQNTPDAKRIQRQASAGLIWSKQYFNLDINVWLKGDPGQPPPPAGRCEGRNSGWKHLFNEDIISMPDKWEYPWYAAWDTAFHMIPFALLDPDFAKRQLGLFLREWYMHPNGQIPAYEWAFSDVNPPVHAWACWRVYKIDAKLNGKPDTAFLESVFHKLLMNFTWWVNRKDASGANIFEGGFLGLDNIGVFDRSKPLPTGGRIEQSDGTSWMAMYCLNMLKIAIELAKSNPVYEDIASKFFEHFLYIAAAMNGSGRSGLWDEKDQFYYDHLKLPDGNEYPMRVRSLVGLIPLFAVDTLDAETINTLPGFSRRMKWFIENRPDLAGNLASLTREGVADRRLLALVGRDRLRAVLRRMLDSTEFLSDYGIRGLSKFHKENPYLLHVGGMEYRVDYEPRESQTSLFGGNSNWRGPVWFPVNYLLIESLQKFHHYHGDAMKVECPAGSGNPVTLDKVAQELSRRLSKLFLAKPDGVRPAMHQNPKYSNDPHFRNHILFYEYFDGDTGEGLGASHQTGWTALVAKLMRSIDC